MSQHSEASRRLERSFTTCGDIFVVGNYAHPIELSECLQCIQLDFVVVDLSFEGEGLPEYLSEWKGEYPETKFLVLSEAGAGKYLWRLCRSGVAACLKREAVVGRAIEKIRRLHRKKLDGDGSVDEGAGGEIFGLA